MLHSTSLWQHLVISDISLWRQMDWHTDVYLCTWRSYERVHLGSDLQKHPRQYHWFLLHVKLWRWQLSPMTLVALHYRTDCIQCRVSLDQSQSHGPWSTMRQHKFSQYQQIHLPPPCCVRLLEIEWSEDPSHAEMSGIPKDNNITVILLVKKCQHKQLCLTYRAESSCPLEGRWCPLAFACKGSLAHRCNDGASGLDSRGNDPIYLPYIPLHWTQV